MPKEEPPHRPCGKGGLGFEISSLSAGVTESDVIRAARELHDAGVSVSARVVDGLIYASPPGVAIPAIRGALIRDGVLEDPVELTTID